MLAPGNDRRRDCNDKLDNDIIIIIIMIIIISSSSSSINIHMHINDNHHKYDHVIVSALVRASNVRGLFGIIVECLY